MPTLRYAILVFAVAVSLAAQQPPDDNWVPGNPDHVKPEEGTFCHTPAPFADPDAKDCDCHTHKSCSIDSETGQRVITEHPKCKHYCWANQCACIVTCPDT